MRLILLVLSVFIFLKPVQAQPVINQSQEKEKQAIIETIQTLFDGFRENDSAKVAATFYDRNPFLGTSFLRNSEFQFRKDAGLEGMLTAIAKPKADSVRWDERIYKLQISLDDGLASVFCPYSFYVGSRFSHCGVNFFTLTKTKAGWKILSIVDTRRKENCE